MGRGDKPLMAAEPSSVAVRPDRELYWVSLAPRPYAPESSSGFLPQERTNGGSGDRDDVNGREARHVDGVVWRTGRMEKKNEETGWIKEVWRGEGVRKMERSKGYIYILVLPNRLAARQGGAIGVLGTIWRLQLIDPDKEMGVDEGVKMSQGRSWDTFVANAA